MEKLKIYALFDRDNKFYHSVGTGLDDKDFASYLINEFNKIYESLNKSQNPDNFINNIRNQDLFLIGDLDLKTGILNSNLSCILSLKDFRNKPVVPDSEEVEVNE